MSVIEDSIQAHHARNRELLKLIANKGADPNVARDIDRHFWTPNEDAARNLSADLRARGYSRVAINRAVADASLWNVETCVHATPLSVVAPVFVEDIVRLAAANDGEFDGWGTSI